MTVITQDERQAPINFRFPRGESGRFLAARFNEIAKALSTENRSMIIRQCIEAGYIVYVDESVLFFKGLKEEEVEMITGVLDKIKATGMARNDDEALALALKMVAEIIAGAGQSDETASLLPGTRAVRDQ